MVIRFLNIGSGLSQKILLWSGCILLLVSGSIIGYAGLSVHNEAVQSAGEEQFAACEYASILFKSSSEDAVLSMDQLADLFTGLKKNNMQVSRQQVDAMLKEIFEKNPQYIQIYTSWDPDAFDGADNQYAGISPYDINGAFESDFYRDDAGTVIQHEFPPGETLMYSADWYTMPRDSGKTIMMAPYVDAVGGKDVLMTSAITPILPDGRFLGIVGVDISLSFLQDQADEIISRHPGSQMLIISPEKTIAAASGRPDLIGSPLEVFITDSSLSPSLDSGKDFQIPYNGPDGRVLIAGKHVTIGKTDGIWTVLILTPFGDITKQAEDLTRQLVLLAIIFISSGLCILYVAVRKMTAPLADLMKGIGSLKQGDLTARVNIQTNDEIEEIGILFNEMAESRKQASDISAERDREQTALNDAILSLTLRAGSGEISTGIDLEPLTGEFRHVASGINSLLEAIRTPLQEMIRVLKQFAEGDLRTHFDESIQTGGEFELFKENFIRAANRIQSLVSALQNEAEALTIVADQLSDEVNIIRSGTSSLTDQTREVSDKTDEINQMNHQILTVLQDLTSSISHVSVRTDDLVNKAHQGNKQAEEGMILSEAAVTRIYSIEDSIGKVVSSMDIVLVKMDQIKIITNTISEIADQTNMLALNAAIEAARAGEAGAGFSVVASAVKELASDSEKSAAQIYEIIKELSETIDQTVHIAAGTANEIQHGRDDVIRSSESFRAIIQEIQAITLHLTDIAGAVEEESATTEEITANAHSTANLVSATAYAANRSASDTKETDKSIQEIARVITRLHETVETLKGQIQGFKI
ncbi:MAG TPA: methyl-accepting chemotaxis protein [Methanospirillum sp.]|nr:methyl-accepting chemotaxis protein [Methanospirillum sp.]